MGRVFSPNFGRSYESLEEALLSMKKKPNDIYSQWFQKEVDFEVVEDKELQHVEFT